MQIDSTAGGMLGEARRDGELCLIYDIVLVYFYMQRVRKCMVIF